MLDIEFNILINLVSLQHKLQLRPQLKLQLQVFNICSQDAVKAADTNSTETELIIHLLPATN